VAHSDIVAASGRGRFVVWLSITRHSSNYDSPAIRPNNARCQAAVQIFRASPGDFRGERHGRTSAAESDHDMLPLDENVRSPKVSAIAPE
jgi:hypothetical protein